jgi:hypothetical protein
MRTLRRALMVLGAMPLLASLPAPAADLAVTPRKAVRVHHARWSTVLDYDGTPIQLRRPLPILLPDGTAVVPDYLYAIYTPRAQPRYYLNGEPVRRPPYFVP